MLRPCVLLFASLAVGTATSFASEEICTENSSKCAKLIETEGLVELFVEVQLPDRTTRKLDVTRIETGLFGKLGIADKSSYERHSLSLLRWSEGAEEIDLLFVQLKAWKDGQRYTVSGPVAITDGGKIIWQ